MTIRKLIGIYRRHGTKLLGTAQVIVASAIAVPGLVPTTMDKYLVFLNLVLGGMTVKRGFTNTKQSTDQ